MRKKNEEFWGDQESGNKLDMEGFKFFLEFEEVDEMIRERENKGRVYRAEVMGKDFPPSPPYYKIEGAVLREVTPREVNERTGTRRSSRLAKIKSERMTKDLSSLKKKRILRDGDI